MSLTEGVAYNNHETSSTIYSCKRKHSFEYRLNCHFHHGQNFIAPLFLLTKKLLNTVLVFLHILGKQSGFDNLWHACLIIEYKFGNAQYIFFLMLPGLKHCQTYVRMILMIIAEPSIIYIYMYSSILFYWQNRSAKKLSLISSSVTTSDLGLEHRHQWFHSWMGWNLEVRLKFVFSEKATKIDQIFTVDLTLTT